MKDYKEDGLWLMQGDCLERMKEIPEGSVDAIICDPQANCDTIIYYKQVCQKYG